MLNLNSEISYQAANGDVWQIYQSASDNSAFFVVPKVQLSTLDNCDYNFSLVEYPGIDSGGYCLFETCLGAGEQVMAEITTFLEQRYLHLKPCVTALKAADVEAKVIYAANNGQVANEVTTPAMSYGHNNAVFLLNLDAAGVALFNRYFSGDRTAGFVDVSYEFTVPGRLPAVTVSAGFNAVKAANCAKHIANSQLSVKQLLLSTWHWIKSLTEDYSQNTAALTKAIDDVDALLDSIARHGDEDSFILRSILTLSSACKVTVDAATSEPIDSKVISRLKTWATTRLEQNISDAYNQARQKSGDSGLAVFAALDAIYQVEKPHQWVDWHQTTTLDWPQFQNFANSHYHKMAEAKRFELLVRADVDFDHLIEHIVVKVTYPGLAANSFTLTGQQSFHLFEAPWDQVQADQYTIEYTATYKENMQQFSVPPQTESGREVTITTPELGLQSVRFDASTIDFGQAADQVDRVEITVVFTGNGITSSTKLLMLNQEKTSALVTSVEKVPVNNHYHYQVAYFQSDKTDAVYTSEQITSNQASQDIFNPLTFGHIDFVGQGFNAQDQNKAMMIMLTVDNQPPVRLMPGHESYSIPCVFSPNHKLVTYSAQIITAGGQVLMRSVTRPEVPTINIGTTVPWWFSVKIDSSLVQWQGLSSIEVTIGQGTADQQLSRETMMLLPSGSHAHFWGYEYAHDEPINYYWEAKYWYQDGKVKTIPLKTAEGSPNILTLPAFVQ